MSHWGRLEMNSAQVAKGSRDAAHRGVIKAAVAVQNTARRRAPVSHGRLRQSIAFRVVETSAGPTAQVGSNVDYVKYVTEGTGIYGPRGEPIRPVSKPTLVFRGSSGRMVFTKEVKGQPPNKFLLESLREILPGSTV